MSMERSTSVREASVVYKRINITMGITNRVQLVLELCMHYSYCARTCIRSLPPGHARLYFRMVLLVGISMLMKIDKVITCRLS